MKKNKNKNSVIALFLCAVIIGFSYLMVKIGLVFSSPIVILCDRLIIGFLALIIAKQLGLIKIEELESKSKMKIFILSIIYPIAFFVFQNFGINHIATSEAAMIYGLTPAFTVLLSVLFLKQKPKLFQQLGVAFSVAGIIYISVYANRSVPSDAVGYLFVTLSVISMASYYIFIKKKLYGISAITITYYLILYATPLMIFVGLILDDKIFNYQRFFQPNYLISIFYLGALSTVMTSLLTNYGIKNLSPTQVSIFTNLSPLFGVLAGIIFLKETLSTHTIIGGLLIFSGVILSLLKPNSK